MGEAIDQAESDKGVVFSYVVILPENDQSCTFYILMKQNNWLLKKYTVQLRTVDWATIKFFNHFKGGTNQNVILFITLRFFKKTWVLFSTREKVGLLHLYDYFTTDCLYVLQLSLYLNNI